MRENAVFLISPQRQVGHREDFLPLSVKCRGFRSSRAETPRRRDAETPRRRDAETPRRRDAEKLILPSLLTHRVIPAFITATIVPIRFPSSSASLRLRARPVPLRSPSQREYLNRLVPVDNSLIFINFMNRLRAKRTDSLTNRFFLLSIRPVQSNNILIYHKVIERNNSNSYVHGRHEKTRKGELCSFSCLSWTISSLFVSIRVHSWFPIRVIRRPVPLPS